MISEQSLRFETTPRRCEQSGLSGRNTHRHIARRREIGRGGDEHIRAGLHISARIARVDAAGRCNHGTRRAPRRMAREFRHVLRREFLGLDDIETRIDRRKALFQGLDLDDELLFRRGPPQALRRLAKRLAVKKDAMLGKDEDRLRKAGAMRDRAARFDRREREGPRPRRRLARAGDDRRVRVQDERL